jgi:predicted Zn-dependent peptidase
MRKLFSLVFIFAVLMSTSFAQKQYHYESVPNDATKTRIYTLDNGLKVYMSVNKEEPKIRVTIATKAGSKLDPAETTGLAHYFEHLMFKGTEHFGTTDYAKEKPMLDQIEQLFEQYRKIPETETEKRAEIFKQIDNISQEASKIAIPNEYDKLMSVIGSSFTNASTWVDFTNYYEEIPMNKLENFLIIQSDRFQHPVLRLFHTELETIYEEKNMTLTQDRRRVMTAMMEGLFPSHPYGTQTTIGTQQDLRNPSITNVKHFFETYYVPNNMAIIMAGDFNPDEAIALIDKYFGSMQSKSIPPFTFTPEKPITSPVVKEVVGKDAENLTIAWRFGNINSEDYPILVMAEMILTNGHAGLVDLNINQKQRLLSAASSLMELHDYTVCQMQGSPKTGQTLDDVKNILFEQIEKLQNGEFEDWLLQAVINDLKKREIHEQESNNSREAAMTAAFYLDIPWKNVVNHIDNLKKITKQQITDFAKKYLTKNNCVLIYKKQGKPNDIEKVKKPKVTPITINREAKSDFVKMIEDRKTSDIEPVFVDFQKDIKTVDAQNGVKVYYTKNDDNDLFSLIYVVNYGTLQDRYISLASSYVEFLSTDKYTAEQIKQEFYKIGCDFGMSAAQDKSYISINGLSENMEKAMELFEHIIANAQPNQKALDDLVADILKSRENAKHNLNGILSRLASYGMYGKESPALKSLNEKELKAITPQFLINKLKEWMSYKQYIIYYGPKTDSEIVANINKIRNPKDLKDFPAAVYPKEAVPEKTNVLIAHYDAPQTIVYMVSFGQPYNQNILATSAMYNEYFGGSMNSIVFQEMREARALAYSAGSYFINPNRLGELDKNIAVIQCGADKLTQSIDAFNELLGNMPMNENSFENAKTAVINRMRTERVNKDAKVWYYLDCQELGLKEDPNKAIFKEIPGITLQDIKKFQDTHVANHPRTVMLVGNTKTMDMKFLKKQGKVKVMNLKDIFGY